MSNEPRKEEVTVTLRKDRTLTHAGKPCKDGQKIEVTPAQKKFLAKRGLIAGGAGKADTKSEAKG